MFEQIKRWYAMGLWQKKHVEDAVKKGVLTRRQADEITGGDATDGKAV